MNGHLFTKAERAPAPVGEDGGEAAALECGDALGERSTPGDEQLLGCGRPVDERVQADRGDAVGESVHGEIDAEAEHHRHPILPGPRPLDLAEDASQLAALDEDIVGPLEARRDAMAVREHVDEREPCCEGDPGRHTGEAADQNRGEQRGAGSSDPHASLAPASGRLLGSDAAEPLVRAPSRGPKHDVLGASGPGHARQAERRKTRFLTVTMLRHTMEVITGVGGCEGGGPMIQETCVEIGELEARWTSLREARNARRQKIRYIDELIDQFEKLNLAEEVEVPYELVGRAVALVSNDTQLAGRSPRELMISEWMDALYEVQDGLMFASEDDSD